MPTHDKGDFTCNLCGPFWQQKGAPVTTLVVENCVTGHYPVCVLYGQSFYYRRLQ